MFDSAVVNSEPRREEETFVLPATETVRETQIDEVRAEIAQFKTVSVSQTQIQQDRANKPPKDKKNSQTGVVVAVA